MENKMKYKTEVFTADEVKELGLTAEEVALFNDAESDVATAETLPENPNEILNKYLKLVPNDFEKAMTVLSQIAEKDPKFFIQLLSMYYSLESVTEAPKAEVQKVSLSDIKTEKNDELMNQLLAKL